MAPSLFSQFEFFGLNLYDISDDERYMVVSILRRGAIFVIKSIAKYFKTYTILGNLVSSCVLQFLIENIILFYVKIIIIVMPDFWHHQTFLFIYLFVYVLFRITFNFI